MSLVIDVAYALLTDQGLEIIDPKAQAADELAERRAFALMAGEVSQ